MMSFVSDGL